MTNARVARQEAPTQRDASLWLLCLHPDQVRKAPIAGASSGTTLECSSHLYETAARSSKGFVRAWWATLPKSSPKRQHLIGIQGTLLAKVSHCGAAGTPVSSATRS